MSHRWGYAVCRITKASLGDGCEFAESEVVAEYRHYLLARAHTWWLDLRAPKGTRYGIMSIYYWHR